MVSGGCASIATGIVAETGSRESKREVGKALYLKAPSDIHPPASLHNLKPPQTVPPSQTHQSVGDIPIETTAAPVVKGTKEREQ